MLTQPSCALGPARITGAHRHADVRVGQTGSLRTDALAVPKDGDHNGRIGWASEQFGTCFCSGFGLQIPARTRPSHHLCYVAGGYGHQRRVMRFQPSAAVPIRWAPHHARVAAATRSGWVHGMAETIRPMDIVGDFNSPAASAGTRTTGHFIRSGTARHDVTVWASLKDIGHGNGERIWVLRRC